MQVFVECLISRQWVVCAMEVPVGVCVVIVLLEDEVSAWYPRDVEE